MGKPVPAGIPFTGMPAIAPVALSFRLFGIGPWQARLPGIFITLGGLTALFCLAHRLYNRSIAIGTLAVALLLFAHPELHPVLIGRQAVGEMPAMFLLLSGFLALTWSWRRPAWFLPLAILLWALALRTKPQLLPFFIASLAAPLIVALWQRRWRPARILAFALFGALLSSAMLARGQQLLLRSSLFAPSSGHELYSWLNDASNYLFTYVIVFDPLARLTALAALLMFGMPVVLGVSYAAWRMVGQRHKLSLDSSRDVGRLMLLTFSASWLAWYLLFSAGRGAYLFPGMLTGAIFAALLLNDIAGGFDLLRLLRRGAQTLKDRPLTVQKTGILLAAVAIPAAFLGTVFMFYRSYFLFADDSLIRTANFLNSQTEPGALIETYDVELFFLLDRPYHYPADPVQDQLNRRLLLFHSNEVDYDALAADPDYIVVGPASQLWQLYDPVLRTGQFHLIFESTRYQVYQRER
jgi:4-amino-4-deoxy-L-arabinose transferase-like glycosyltransferase